MHFSQYDLDQISGDTLAHLSPEQLLLVSERILSDLTEAMDLLNQQSNNRVCELDSSPIQNKLE